MWNFEYFDAENGDFEYFDVHKRITIEKCSGSSPYIPEIKDQSEYDVNLDGISDFGSQGFQLQFDTRTSCGLCGKKIDATTNDILPNTPSNALNQFALLDNVLKEGTVENIQVSHSASKSLGSSFSWSAWNDLNSS